MLFVHLMYLAYHRLHKAIQKLQNQQELVCAEGIHHMYKIYRASRQNSGSIFDTGGIKAETANRTYSVPGAGCETVVNRTSNRPRIERFERPYCSVELDSIRRKLASCI
jgi:hypothetical protein